MLGFGGAVLWGISMGIVQWIFYILGIICMIKYLREKKNE
jgi:hypothetical protein